MTKIFVVMIKIFQEPLYEPCGEKRNKITFKNIKVQFHKQRGCL